jgi:hypothetical protein
VKVEVGFVRKFQSSTNPIALAELDGENGRRGDRHGMASGLVKGNDPFSSYPTASITSYVQQEESSMAKYLLGTLAAILVLAPAPAQEKPVRPAGATPLLFIVTAVSADGLVISPAPVPTKEVHPTRVEYRVAYKGMAATDPKGKQLTPAEVAKRVKPGSVVLVNEDDRPVDPAYLAILQDDVVILAGVVPPRGSEGVRPAK